MFVVHCRVKPWGALQVLEALILKKLHAWQSVDALFTLYSDRDVLRLSPEREIPIVTALPCWLNRLFRRSDRNNPRYISSIIDYRNLMPFFPLLMKVLSYKLQKRYQNLLANDHKLHVLISSYAVAKNIDLPANTSSEIFFHQPMHYIRPLYDEYVTAMKGRKQRLYIRITPYLRRRDSKRRTYDSIYANSESTKQQISTIYHLDSSKITVLHCPIDPQFFDHAAVTVPDNYFFYINRLTKLFKNLDKIILMCNHFQINLLIAWDGPDKEYLMSIAGPTITFLWRISDKNTKMQLISRARGVINIAHESFGIVTAEALLLWVPVFGYAHGASPELIDQKSWILTDSIVSETMYPLFQEFVERDFDREEIQLRARTLLSEKQKFWRV